MYPRGEKRFVQINLITIVALFVLIFAGGIVRSSGSGMGCPDWPKCFGTFIPPTDVSQLPAGYQKKYVDQRVEKNQKFAKTLDVLGFGDLADRVRNDRSILLPEDFNVAKTWTEYVNRLIGAITGMLLLACVFFSTVYWGTRRKIFIICFLNVFLVGFQAWLGSIVVSTNLLAWVVTVHMLLALLIVALSIYTYYSARALHDKSLAEGSSQPFARILAIAILIFITCQIAIGTEVREQVDTIASELNGASRSEWVAKLGFDLNLHRDMAVVLFLFILALLFLIRKDKKANNVRKTYSVYVLIFATSQILTGIILSYFALPPVAQTMHLVLATLMFSAQFYLVLLTRNNYSIAD
jgi:cytochrome c oxidase assembly protein subunit 15